MHSNKLSTAKSRLLFIKELYALMIVKLKATKYIIPELQIKKALNNQVFFVLFQLRLFAISSILS